MAGSDSAEPVLGLELGLVGTGECRSWESDILLYAGNGAVVEVCFLRRGDIPLHAWHLGKAGCVTCWLR